MTFDITDFPAYIDSGFSDNPLKMTLFPPKMNDFILKVSDIVTSPLAVTLLPCPKGVSANARAETTPYIRTYILHILKHDFSFVVSVDLRTPCSIQGDHSRCYQPPVDLKTKVTVLV